MMLDYINEAFKSLDLLTEDVFKADSEGINELSDFMSDDETEETISIIDMDAETEDDIQASYVGKVIVDCNVCHSHVFKDKENIKIDDDGVVDIEEECPYCGENNGFVIIGEIHEFKPEAEAIEDTESEEEISTNSEEVEETIEESLTESIWDDEDDVEFEETIAPDILDAAKKILNDHGYSDVYFDPDSMSNKDFITATKDGVDYEAEFDLDSEIDTFYGFNKNVEECAKWYADSIMKKFEGIEESLTEESNMSKLRAKYPELAESFKNVSLETEDQIMTMTSEDNGKVTVTTEPTTNESAEGEVIAPVTPETEKEIIDANAEVIEEPVEELPAEEEELDFDFEEVDEDSMNELGESYLKKVYENVDSFKLTSCSTTANQLIMEGLITFKSGVKKNTGFIFEAKDATKDGKLRFIGENAHLCRGRKAFTLVGSMSENKLMCESFTYNYRAKNAEGKSTRVYGKVNRNK